jgi:hypothetical protein
MVIRMVDKIINVLKEKQCYDCEHWYYECRIPFDGCERFLELSPDEIAELAEHLEKNDVIKVVRCKDCSIGKGNTPKMGAGWVYCINNGQYHKETHFCSYGERRCEE